MDQPPTPRLPPDPVDQGTAGHQGDSSDLLFLDVDGVLHPVGTDYSFSSRFFSHLPLLEELLQEFRSIDVVISSDWRLAIGRKHRAAATVFQRRHPASDHRRHAADRPRCGCPPPAPNGDPGLARREWPQ